MSNSLRQSLRHARQSIPAKQRAIYQTRIHNALIDHLVHANVLHSKQSNNDHTAFNIPRKLALYLANDGEVDLESLVPLFWQNGIELFLPVITPSPHSNAATSNATTSKATTSNGLKMDFARYTENTALVTDTRYGLRQPQNNSDTQASLNTITAEELDIVLTPLVGFDSSGTRLGMGGGFYDRYFAKKLLLPTPPAAPDLPNPTSSSSPLKQKYPKLIGMAFECQRCDALTRHAWDVPLDAVITEQGYCAF